MAAETQKGPTNVPTGQINISGPDVIFVKMFTITQISFFGTLQKYILFV